MPWRNPSLSTVATLNITTRIDMLTLHPLEDVRHKIVFWLHNICMA